MGKAPQPGDTLEHGKYRLVRELGRGNMGTVFLAEHTLSRKRCAIKYLHPERAGAPHAIERMVLEARAAARVEHPHAVSIHDVCRDGEAAFLVMEYLEGETLREHFAQGPKLPHAIVAQLIPGMRAVHAAHESGVIHRDIKPENIFLARVPDTAGLVTKILDFGVSKLLEGAEQSLTIAGSIIGTPMYMSYEQLIAAADIDRRTDVYAFGVVLYEALTGQLPYSARSVADLAAKMREAPPMASKALRGELPSTLSNLVSWALHWDREQRIASLDAFIRELEPFSTPQSYAAELTASASLAATEVAPPRLITDPTPVAPPAPVLERSAAAIPKPPDTAPLSQRRRAMPWLIAVAALALAAYAAAMQLARPLATTPAAAPRREMPLATVRVSPAPEPAPSAPPPIAVPPVAAPESPVTPPVTAHGSKSEKSRRRLAIKSPVLLAEEPAPPPPTASDVIREARERRAADVARLREQLVLCGDLKSDVVRTQCKERTKHELAEREEDHELADHGARSVP